MSDASDSRATAGSLLRAARERQGLHIAALAAAIKVTPRKLDALEHDRYGELPDATFTRALAQTVCRSLKVDPQPVLALLPQADPTALDHVSGTLNAPFRERPGRDGPRSLAVTAIRPMVWAGLALMLAAAAVVLLPRGMFTPATAPPVAAPPLAAASLPAAASSPEAVGLAASAVEFAASAPVVQAVPPAPQAAAAPPASTPPLAVATVATAATLPATMVQVRTDEASWIEVRDARGQVLLSRIVRPGESIGLDGTLPLKMTIGNAPATRLSFRGKPVDLAPSTRDTVARLELQ